MPFKYKIWVVILLLVYHPISGFADQPTTITKTVTFTLNNSRDSFNINDITSSKYITDVKVRIKPHKEIVEVIDTFHDWTSWNFRYSYKYSFSRRGAYKDADLVPVEYRERIINRQLRKLDEITLRGDVYKFYWDGYTDIKDDGSYHIRNCLAYRSYLGVDVAWSAIYEEGDIIWGGGGGFTQNGKYDVTSMRTKTDIKISYEVSQDVIRPTVKLNKYNIYASTQMLAAYGGWTSWTNVNCDYIRLSNSIEVSTTQDSAVDIELQYTYKQFENHSPISGQIFKKSQRPVFQAEVFGLGTETKTLYLEYFNGVEWVVVSTKQNVIDKMMVTINLDETTYKQLPYYENLKFRFRIENMTSEEIHIQKAVDAEFNIYSPINNEKVINENIYFDMEVIGEE